MKISSIQNIYRINNNFKLTQTSFKANNDGDIFVKSKPVKKDFFSFVGIDKFGIKDYKALTKKQIRNTKKINDLNKMQDTAKNNITAAIALKESLDNKYGENNYVFECIGNSPAGIGRVMEFMGVETHYFPMSNISERDENNITNTINSNEEGKEEYKKYLSSQGVTPNMTDNNKKHFLFYDYTCSGYSLKNFQKILEKCFDIPSSENIEYRSLNDELYKLAVSSKQEIVMQKYIILELGFCNVENYCGIPHLDPDNIDRINRLDEPTRFSPEYNFCVIDELKKQGLLKENPLNKCNKF